MITSDRSVLSNAARLLALRETGLLDTPAEPEFDRWTRLIRKVLGADVSLITLVDEDRQFFKSAAGLGEPWATERQTPMSHSFCQYVVMQDDALVVSDAREDPELRDNRAIEEMAVIAYAGVPIRARHGHLLGSLAAIQSEPREWTEEEVDVLRDLCVAVSTQIELKALEARTRAITDSVSDLVSIVDREGRVLYHSSSLTRILGREPAEELGRSLFELVHPEDRAAFRETHRRVLAEEAGAREVRVRVRHQNGEYRVLEGRLTNLTQEATIHGVLLVARDITEQQVARARLRQREQWFRTLVERTFDVIAVVDEDMRISYQSPAISRLLGTPPEEQVGESALHRMHPDDMEEARAAFRYAVANPESPVERELRFRHADGSWRTLEVVGRSFLHDPAIRGIVLNLRDVTERKELEARLVQSQKMEAIGRLAGGIAHDFNNLLTVIGGAAELALEELSPAAPGHDAMATVRDATDRAGELTGQLLAFSRQQILRPRPVDLNDVVERSDRLLTRVIGEDVELVTELEDEPCVVEIDPVQIEQVIMNLAVNARDAMPEGGRLVVRTQLEREGDAAGGESPGRVVLEVVDTGVGMDRATRDRVFDPFFTTKETGKGTGLGLATVYGIVEQSGGRIEVDSTPGEGTRFTLVFQASIDTEPVAVDEEEAAPEAEEAAIRATILLTEDDAAVRGLSERVLELAGHTVLTAEHGADALEVASRNEGVDLLITDIVMPGMSGLELASRLRADYPGLAVLFVSGYTAEATAEIGEVIDTEHFLEKPFTPAELREVVGRLVGGRDRPGDR